MEQDMSWLEIIATAVAVIIMALFAWASFWIAESQRKPWEDE